MQSNTSALATYLTDLLRDAKTNRQDLDRKWARNYGYAECNDAFTGPTWKLKERSKSWKSDTQFDVIRQKIQIARSLCSDIMFKGGRIPMMLVPDPRVVQSSDPQHIRDIQAAVDANEDAVDRDHRAASAVRVFNQLLTDGACYGEYIAKSYVTDASDTFYVAPAPGILVKQTEVRKITAIERKSLWNIWRDLESQNIAAGAYVFEREMVTPEDLAALKANPLFDAEAIDRVLGTVRNRTDTASSTPVTDTSTQPPGERTIPKKLRSLEKIETWARVPRDKVAEFAIGRARERMTKLPPDQQPAAAQELQSIDETIRTAKPATTTEADKIEVFAVLVETEIIAFLPNPGPRPYFRGEWEPALDGTHGRGIADNTEHIQRAITGALRSFENNTKLIANLIIAVKRRMIKNKLEDAIDEGGILEMAEEMGDEDIDKAVKQLKFDDITGPLVQALNMLLQFADLASMVPRAEQGQQSDNPQTAFELQQRLEKSGKYMADVVRRFDDLIEWASSQVYDYIAQDPDSPVPKIPCVVKPLGFTSFENRYMRLQKLMQFLALLTQDRTNQMAPIVNVRWILEEIGKAMDLEVDQLVKSVEQVEAEQQAAIAAQQAAQPPPEQPPPDPPEKIDALAAKAERDRADAEHKRVKAGVALAKAAREQAQMSETPTPQPQGAEGP